MCHGPHKQRTIVPVSESGYSTDMYHTHAAPASLRWRGIQIRYFFILNRDRTTHRWEERKTHIIFRHLYLSTEPSIRQMCDMRGRGDRVLSLSVLEGIGIRVLATCVSRSEGWNTPREKDGKHVVPSLSTRMPMHVDISR